MKTRFLVLLSLYALASSIKCWGAGGIDRNDSGLIEKKHKLYYQSLLFSGMVVEHWANGTTFKEIHYEKGQENGSSQKFDLNGHLVESSNYRLGKKNGLQQGWFEEGPKKFEYHFKHGLLDGVQTEWHLNGAVFRKQKYVLGKEVENKVLYPTGNIFTNYAKRDGRIYGQDGGKLCQEPAKKDGEK